MKDKDFLSTEDWTPRELSDFLDYAARIKAGGVETRLDGKTLGLVFFNPSLRTRVSFEVAMHQLGGQVVNLEVGRGVWGIETRDGVVMDGRYAEHMREAAGVLSRYVDILGVRAFADGENWEVDREDRVVRGFARHAAVPVINLESAMWHPCQSLADALTWQEVGLKAGDPLVLTWTYHPKALPMAVPNSVMLAAAQYGLETTVLRPPEYALDPELTAHAEAVAAQTGGSFRQTANRTRLNGCRAVYAKSWGSLEYYGLPQEEERIREGYQDWQVTPEWMDVTDAACFMHCLPVRRNVVVADAVLDSPSSVVLQQAENRLHVQKALLSRILGESDWLDSE